MMKNFALSCRFKSIAIASLLALAGTAFSQNAVYRWTGPDGVTHYGATPPKGIEAELMKAGGSGNRNNDQTSNGVGTETNNSGENTGAEAAPVKLSPEMQARKDTLCKGERERLEKLRKPGRIRMNQPDGSTRYLTMEEVQTEINTTQRVIDETCK